jgi:hypothetical protein
MREMTIVEAFMSALLMMVHPEQYVQAVLARQSAQRNPQIVGSCPTATQWPSVMSGVSLILNRRTPGHRDRHGPKTGYDLLLSLGTATDVTLDLEDVGAQLPYSPGTVNAICGRVLTHEVSEWPGDQDRICYAHWLREFMLSDKTGALSMSTVARCRRMLGERFRSCCML